MVLSGRIAALAATVGFIAVVAGVATPGWISVKFSIGDLMKGTENSDSGDSFGSDTGSVFDDLFKLDIKVSIFYFQMCSSGIMTDVCIYQFHTDLEGKVMGQSYKDEFNSKHWMEKKIGAGLALCLGLLGMICSYMPLFCSRINKITPAIAASVILGIASILTLVLVGRVAKINVDLDHDSFPYSLVLAGGGAACLLAASVSAMISVCMMRNDQGGQVVSAVQAGGGVHLANIVPGIQNTSQGYAVLEEPNLTIQT